MKIKDVDLDIIKSLLDGVPSDLEIESIDLYGNTYSLNLTANYSKIQENENQEKLHELIRIIKAIEEH